MQPILIAFHLHQNLDNSLVTS